jgi:putative serine/threonine protein kinase
LEGQIGLTKFIKPSNIKDTHLKRFISYPKYNEDDYTSKIRELKDLSIEGLASGGPHRVEGHNLLGKGHVGIVLKGKMGAKTMAVKIRRTDADRPNMFHEAKMLKLANSKSIGPTIYSHSKNVIVMELIQGNYLGQWVKEKNPNKITLNTILKELLVKTHKLDKIGLDHGELIDVKRHFLITEKGPRIIDFESASTNRRTKNVTTTIQSFFINKSFKTLIENIREIPKQGRLNTLLRKYKDHSNRENFQEILRICGLEDTF